MSRNSVGRVAVLLCLAALLSVSYSSRRRPFRSIKAPVGKALQLFSHGGYILLCIYFRDAETVETYSVVVPEVTHIEQGDGGVSP